MKKNNDIDNNIFQNLMETVDNYILMVREELHERWKNWKIDLQHPEMYEVIGALLARQVTLATQFANAPTIWTGHVAPIILRAMIDTYITLAWIFGDPPERSRKFISYGLGQAKLSLEHRKKQMEADGLSIENDPLIRAKEDWLNSQRLQEFTEVNVGSWSGMNTREMAEVAGCIDFYNYSYTPFSAVTHSMWNHISIYNLTECRNPLHRYHKVPVDADFGISPDFFYTAAKYVEKAFKLFDEKTGVVQEAASAFEFLVDALAQLGGDSNEKENTEIND